MLTTRLFFSSFLVMASICGCYDGASPAPVDPIPDIGKADGAVCPGTEDPDVRYLGESPEACAAIRFTCEEHEAPFFDACGCGCQAVDMCPNPDPALTYLADDPDRCAVIRFTCEEGSAPFFDECGCGCREEGSECPDPDDPAVTYIDENPSACAAIRFACPTGEEPFTDACGCGCIATATVVVPPLTYASPEEQALFADKLAVDIAAVHENGRVAFTDLFTYPTDLAMPAPLRSFVLSLPFETGTWVRCQQANNNVDHQHPGGASHGPDKTLRYSLDLSLGGDEVGLTVTASAAGVAYGYGGSRHVGPGEWNLETAADNGGLGNFVAVVHDNGFASLYSHLDAIAIEDGTRIEAGEAVGTVGRTGGAGVAHLHFHVVPVYRTPTPGVVAATDHAAFAAEYNATFGPSVPFWMQVGRSADGESTFEQQLDSRLFVSDYYGIDGTVARTELDYWYQAM